MLPEHKPVEDPIRALSIVCNAQARQTLEKLLGPATVVVETVVVKTGGIESYTLHYRLEAPAESQDALRKFKLVCELATKIAGVRRAEGRSEVPNECWE
jgi:hypothetical protein